MATTEEPPPLGDPWLGRLCLEWPNTTITELRLALAAFDRLPEEPQEAEAELRRLVRS